MLYIYVLGYEVDFGHMEALNLITSPGFPEKTVGYLACVLLLSETNEFLRLIINSCKVDLASQNEEIQGLSLACIANVGGREFAETLTPDVQRIMLAQGTRPVVKKKAALCLLRLFRKYPDAFGEDGLGGNQEFKDKLLNLLDDTSLGVVTATMSLLLGLVSYNPSLWPEAVNKCCRLLAMLNHPNAPKQFGVDYVYYKTVCPWLQVKILRLLQYYPPPAKEEVYNKLCEILNKLLSETQMQKNVNTNNAAHAVVFEVVNYVIHIETNKDLTTAAVTMLGLRLVATNQPNYRYLALDSMQRMANIPEAAEQFKKHQEVVTAALKDNDVSLRRRALDVLYSMCDSNNSAQIVAELLDYLNGNDFAIREELVLRVAILAERFAPNFQWYVDTILKLMTLAGNYVSDQIWMRVVQIVTNHEDLQLYAAETCFRAMRSEPVHESMVKCGGYILGEFGHHIAHKRDTSPEEQFHLLRDKFVSCEQMETRLILLTAFVKIINAHPQSKGPIVEFMRNFTSTMDAEMQQRAVEYLSLASEGRESMLESVLDMMPAFPERENMLTKKIRAREQAFSTSTATAPREEEERPAAAAPVELATPAAAQSRPKASTQADLLGDLGSEPSAPAPTAAATVPAKSTGLEDLLGGMSVGGGAAAHAPAASVPAKPSGGGGLLDDLLGGGVPAPSSASVGGGGGGGSLMDDLLGLAKPAAPTAPSHGPAASLTDLLGGGGGGGGASVAAPPAAAGAGGSPKERLHALMLSDSGVLHEDAALSIQVQMQFQGLMGRVQLRYVNKTQAPIDGLRFVLPPTPAPLLQAAPVPSSLAPGFAHPQMINVQLTDLFSEPPRIQIAYTHQGRQEMVDLRLPIGLSKFMQPVVCNRDQFFGVWGRINGPPNEITQVFKGKGPVDAGEIERMLTGMRYAPLKDIDPNPSNFCAAAKLATATAGEVYCVLRMETQAAQQAYKLTVKTSHAMSSAATRQLVLDHLAAPA